MSPKSIRLPAGKQPGETVLEWLQRLTRRYSRSRSPSLRREARQWRAVVRRYRSRLVGGAA